jgi:hypothetical protein
MLRLSHPKGTPGLFPSLNSTPMVQQADATTLIRVVLRGALSVATNAAPTGPEMPAFGWILNDDQVADVSSLISAIGGENSASAVDPAIIKKRAKPWSSAAIDRRSGEIEDPNNCKHDDDCGDIEAEHTPHVMPGHSLPSLSCRDHWALLRTLGEGHGFSPDCRS